MTYDTYRYIFIASAIACGVMLIVTILMFILMRIPRTIGDLSGANAKKAIKKMREQNEKNGGKAHKGSSYNERRGRLTDKISPSGTLRPNNTFGGFDTSQISNNAPPSEETTVLGTYAPEDFSQTTVLDTGFTVDYEITFIHTDEIISEGAVR